MSEHRVSDAVAAQRRHLLATGYTPLPAIGKAVLLPDWRNTPVDQAMVEAWEERPEWPSTGVRTGLIIGVDIDILDAAKAERAKNLALQMLGNTPLIRVGQSPKHLLVYRVAALFKKKWIHGEMNPATGKPHQIEVLADGQQFLAYGIHPDTQKPYVWPEADLCSVPADRVPLVTEEALQAFLTAAQEIIGQPPKPAPTPSPAPSRVNGHDSKPETAEVLEALYAIPCASLDYHEWVKVGFALYANLGAGAAGHYEAWSATDANRYKSGEPARKWPSFARNDSIHAETLFWMARDHGWKPERERVAPAAELGIFKPKLPRHDPETGEILEEVAEPAAGSATPRPLVAFTPYVRIDPGKIPPRRFVYGRNYIRQFMAVDIAPGGMGKSSLVIAEAVAMAAHRDLLGVFPTERIKVAYWNGEDPPEELQRRVEAVCMNYGIPPAEMDGHLFVDSGRILPLILAKEERHGAVLNQDIINAIIASIKENALDVLIIDPFIASHRVKESDNNSIEMVARAWSHIADVTNCAVNLVHHSRKLNGEEVTAESARGASALLAAARAARTLNQMTKDEAAQLNVENHRLYFRVDDGAKPNLSPPSDSTVWHQLVNVDLPNGPMGTVGDKVGVVTRWERPDPMGQLTARDLLAVQNAVGSGRWRENAQARDWVGKAIAQALKLSLPDEASRVKYLLRVWLKSGALTIVQGLDSKRMPREFIEVGNWVELDD